MPSTVSEGSLAVPYLLRCDTRFLCVSLYHSLSVAETKGSSGNACSPKAPVLPSISLEAAKRQHAWLQGSKTLVPVSYSHGIECNYCGYQLANRFVTVSLSQWLRHTMIFTKQQLETTQAPLGVHHLLAWTPENAREREREHFISAIARLQVFFNIEYQSQFRYII